MNLYDILSLKFPEANFISQIILRDDGQGVYIHKWDDNLAPLPTEKDIAKWAVEVELLFKQKEVREIRACLYPPIQTQLDMQYWDKLNNTTVWKDTITQIKQNNPIPTE